MADGPLSFDELLSLASRGGPVEYHVKAWGGRKVFVRDPSSADVDEWRMWCNKHQDGQKPLAAKLVQIMLCDGEGEKLVPQDDDGLQALADGNPKAIDEIAKFCIQFVNEPTDADVEEIQKN